MAIAPDGKTAISGSFDPTNLKFWDTKSGAFFGSEYNTLKVWDLLSGKEVASFSGDTKFECCAIAPDGVTVVAGDRSGRVHFLRLEGVKQLTVDC